MRPFHSSNSSKRFACKGSRHVKYNNICNLNRNIKYTIVAYSPRLIPELCCHPLFGEFSGCWDIICPWVPSLFREEGRSDHVC